MLWLAGVLVLLLWLSSTRRLDWRIGVGGAAVLIVGWAIQKSWRSVTRGQLFWDGTYWRWESTEGQTVIAPAMSVVADLQRVLVVVLDNGAGRRFWFCAERSAFPMRWLDFRRAVYNTRRTSDGTTRIDHVAG